MDEFVHWPKLYLLLSSTCDEILSWMIKLWMKNHLISNNNLQDRKSIIFLKSLQGMTNNIGSTLSVGGTTPRYTVSDEQDN